MDDAAPDRIVLPPYCGDFDWVEDLPLPPLTASGVEINAYEITRSGPVLLVRLSAFVHTCQAADVPVSVVPPDDAETLAYFGAMRLADALPLDAGLGLGEGDSENILIPVRRLATQADSDALDDDFETLFRERFDGSYAPLMDPFHSAVSELCDNATTHGSSAAGAYIAAERGANNRCILAIGDVGPGIPAHVRRAIEAQDDAEALDRATEEGVSGTGDPHRGMGYHWVRDSILQAAVPRADLRIWSGAARLQAVFRHGILTYQQAEAAPPTAGTWVRLELRRS